MTSGKTKTSMGSHNFLMVVGTLTVLGLTDANAADWHVSGYVKSYGVAQGEPDISGTGAGNLEANYQSQNALRLMIGGEFANEASVELHYELKPIFSSEAFGNSLTGFDATTSSGRTSYRAYDINNQTSNDDGTRTLIQNLDRLNIRFETAIGDVTIGRQAISFGSARFVSPTDIFEPFLVSTLDTEYRTGVDAARFQGSFGDFSEFDFGVVVGEDAEVENSSLYGRFKTSLVGNDVETVVIVKDDMTLIGGGVERAIGNLGFWAEGAYTFVDGTQNYVRGSIGLDRAFGEDILGMIEYHHSQAGATDPANYLAELNSPAFQDGGVYLLGENYLIPALNWTATPLLGIAASAFVNLDDASTFLRLNGEYNPFDNLYTDVGLFVGVGKGTNVSLVPATIDVGSEFGAFPATAYVSMRYYF